VSEGPATLPGSVLDVGTTLAGRYRLLELLGAGGMGAVYRVLDTEIDEEVALKVLSAVNQSSLARFRREVKLARRVTHPNVARTFDLGSHGEVRFLTMELIQGESVAQRFQTAKVPLGEALRIAAEVARGLAAAHAAGVVHRDLKPENVMLSSERVAITDFGIARASETRNVDATFTKGGLVGTPAYMAPEQVEGGAVDGRTDVFALGVMLFEMLSGQLPFGGDTPIAIALSRLTASPPDLRALGGAPEGVARLVESALARQREQRPDAVGLLEGIEVARGRAVPAHGFTPNTVDLVPVAGTTRTVAVRPFESDAAGAELARDLASAVADGASGVARITVVPPALGASGGEVAIEGSVRVSGDRARVRVRILDLARTSQTWAASLDGALADPFDLEDRVVAAVLAAIRTHVARSADAGPDDPELREPFARARAAYDRFALPHVQEAIGLCETILAKAPGEPHTMGLLAAALIRAWAQRGAMDSAMAARGEELALRAIAADPSLPEPYHVVAALRFFTGEMRTGLRAEEEALRRMPLHAGAHSQIGRLLCASGRFEEGLRRLELSSRVDPLDVTTSMERARTLALLGQRDVAAGILADVSVRAGPIATLVLETRLAVWFGDAALAANCAERIRANRTGAAWEQALPLMESIVAARPAPEAERIFGGITSQFVAPRHRAMMFAIAAEYFARMGLEPQALGALEEAARLPTVDLLWMDRCEAMRGLREDPRFTAARALVAARVADLWS